MDKVITWLTNQVQYAKAMFTVVVVLGGLLGYQITAKPIENSENLSVRLSNIEKSLKDLDVRLPVLPRVEKSEPKAYPLPETK